MGQGQPWLKAHHIPCLSGHQVLHFLLLILALPWNIESWPTNTIQPVQCPSVCQCFFPDSPNSSERLSAICTDGLTKLPPDLPKSLTSLSLRGNKIREISNLSILNELQFLDISNNSLEILGGESLHNLTKLTTLILSFNAIDTIKSDAFMNLSDIHTVNLAYNHLTCLNSDMLSGLENIKVLNLTWNMISEMSNKTFLYLQRLKILDLSHNQLDYLPSDAFQGLDSVHTILLQSNNLFSVTGVFNGFQHLTTLDLSYNSLDALQSNTFANLFHLDSLQLSFNNITEISPTFFSNSTSLRILDLQGNSLEHLLNGQFQNFQMLQELDLSLMPYLRSISFDAFQGVQSLNFLNLSFNPQLSFVHPQLVAFLPQLTVLDLRSNNISHLSHITFHSNPKLSSLYLAENPWQCGCGLAWVVQDVLLDKSSVVADIDSIKCKLQSNITSVPISQVSQEMMQCNNVSLTNVTDVVSAKIGSQLMLTCDYNADETGVLTWTTPRGLTFHYHPFHPEAISHLTQAEEYVKSSAYNSDLQHSSGHIVLQADGSLLIDFVLRSDAGPYHCMIHNSHHNASATITLLLDYSILFEVKIMSIIVGLACAATFFTLNAVYVVIMWGARKLINKRRRERIHKLLESLDEYRTTQIARIRTNYSYQLGRIREHYHTQSMRLKENYTTQMKRVRQGCSNQVERIRDNYHTRLNHLKEYSSHQIHQIREATNNQIIRIRDYGSLQMERLRETYKLQQQHVLKAIEAMNLENCRTVVETECMRTESMIFDISFPDLDDDNTSLEEASSQISQNDSVYVTALNSDGSMEESLATIVEGQNSNKVVVDSMTIEVLPSDPPADVADSQALTLPTDNSPFPANHESGEADSMNSSDGVRETIV